ncbi:MAG: PD-(D/E)XK nuclease family protein [Woeseiaceae bacterium]|nr:PD-(D/E)XK nuclease family protein [Woeseiaceae bacterium]
MYDWLPDALGSNAQVVTANRRLSRVLQQAYGRRQAQSGQQAWPTPAVSSWRDWLVSLQDNASGQDRLPTRISVQQSAIIWERCLRKELDDTQVSIAGLVRLSLEAWSRIHEWQLPLDDCRRFAHNQDQRLFAAAARRYAGVLEHERWIDDAGIAALVLRLLNAQRLSLPGRITLAGFDRVTPLASSLIEAIEAGGTHVSHVRVATGAGANAMRSFENPDAELRAAGAWARRRLQEERGLRLGIVSPGLEQDAARRRRLVLEGFAPGWQYGESALEESVNVSYGRRLDDFPAIATALLALRWADENLPAQDVGLLLRSPLIGSATTSGRARLELMLRQLPDRAWSPQLVVRALRPASGDTDAVDWLRRAGLIADFRRSHPRRASPSEWAEAIDELMSLLGWPGEATLASDDYQLINRWRSLLNEFARLEIVSTTMTFSEAVRRIASLAADTVFQPESEWAAVDLLGPLEASGMEFDAVWLTGLTAASWPPAGRPSPLVSRRLQREYGMPDADPADTAEYAGRVLQRLASSATELVCSYAVTDEDAEQAPTTLLGELDIRQGDAEPGWHASGLLEHRSLTHVIADPAPALLADEAVAGGAATVQRQLADPFSAFVSGRLGVRYLQAWVTGLAANMRGNLVHDALAELYADHPSQSEISAWDAVDLRQRVFAASRKAFARLWRHADNSLRSLLELERQRVERLLTGVVALDKARDGFEIDSVEGELDTSLHGVALRLRCDRIDRLDDGRIAVIDYKTGARKRFVDRHGTPNDFQLVVYASALHEDPAGLALVNIDSRDISIDGAGTAFDDGENWHRRLGGWKAEVRTALDHIARGDVRINARVGIKDARPLALLSRFAELRHDN